MGRQLSDDDDERRSWSRPRSEDRNERPSRSRRSRDDDDDDDPPLRRRRKKRSRSPNALIFVIAFLGMGMLGLIGLAFVAYRFQHEQTKTAQNGDPKSSGSLDKMPIIDPRVPPPNGDPFPIPEILPAGPIAKLGIARPAIIPNGWIRMEPENAHVTFAFPLPSDGGGTGQGQVTINDGIPLKWADQRWNCRRGSTLLTANEVLFDPPPPNGSGRRIIDPMIRSLVRRRMPIGDLKSEQDLFTMGRPARQVVYHNGFSTYHVVGILDSPRVYLFTADGPDAAEVDALSTSFFGTIAVK